MAFVTDGAFFPDGRHYVLRGYGSAEVYTYPGNERVASFRLPAQRQGEGIAVDSDGWVHVSSEGQHSRVLRVVSASVWGWLSEFVSRAVGLLHGHGAAA
jgi:hypothetical protein